MGLRTYLMGFSGFMGATILNWRELTLLAVSTPISLGGGKIINEVV